MTVQTAAAGPTPAAVAAAAQEERGWQAADDASHVVSRVRAGRTGELTSWLVTLASDDPQRLIGLIVALAVVAPVGPVAQALAIAVPTQTRLLRQPTARPDTQRMAS